MYHEDEANGVAIPGEGALVSPISGPAPGDGANQLIPDP